MMEKGFVLGFVVFSAVIAASPVFGYPQQAALGASGTLNANLTSDIQALTTYLTQQLASLQANLSNPFDKKQLQDVISLLQSGNLTNVLSNLLGNNSLLSLKQQTLAVLITSLTSVAKALQSPFWALLSNVNVIATQLTKAAESLIGIPAQALTNLIAAFAQLAGIFG